MAMARQRRDMVAMAKERKGEDGEGIRKGWI
jgi:hypothetical protein